MGGMCGAAKGSAEESAEINFRKTDVACIDEFFDKCKETVEAFTGCLEPVQAEKEKFFEETGFEFVPGAKVKHGFNGMFLQLGSQANGDLDALKMDWKDAAPFVFVDPTTLGEDGTRIYRTFEDYVNALNECVTTKLPDILKTAEELPKEAMDIKDKAEPEFGKLDPLKQGKAVMMTGRNIKELEKLPKQVQEGFNNLKAQLEELKEAVEDLKNNLPKLATDAKKCSDAGVVESVACYKQIYGPVPCTPEEKAEWEAFMKAKFEKKGRIFDPSPY